MVAKFKEEKSGKFIESVKEGISVQKKCKQVKVNEEHLQFYSDIEGGNLDQAFQVDTNAYDLYMRVDTNTKGHQQWFYFRVGNLKR